MKFKPMISYIVVLILGLYGCGKQEPQFNEKRAQDRSNNKANITDNRPALEAIRDSVSRDQFRYYTQSNLIGGVFYYKIKKTSQLNLLLSLKNNDKLGNCSRGNAFHFNYTVSAAKFECKTNIYLIPLINIVQKLDKSTYLASTSFHIDPLIPQYIHGSPPIDYVVFKSKRFGFNDPGKANFFVWAKYVGVYKGKTFQGFSKDYFIFEEYLPEN